MEARNDDQRIAVLEKKIDDGFAEMRSEFKAVRTEIGNEVNAARGEARADFRTMMALVFGLWATTALAVVGILIGHV
jgi:nitrate reductase NapE component